MARQRKTHAASFKAQVALAAFKGDKTINELAKQFSVHATLIHAWKKQLQASVEDVFSRGGSVSTEDHQAVQTQLYEQIGRLKMELEWLKKNCLMPAEAKRQLVEVDHPKLSVIR